MRSCLECGRPVPISEGRGAKPRYCPDCKVLRATISTRARQQRRSIAVLTELVDVFGPAMARRLAPLAGDAAGHCDTCGAECAFCSGRRPT